MPEPVNPEDHSIRGDSPAQLCLWRCGNPTDDPHDLALIEAIHQTFERDAARFTDGRVCKNCGNEYRAGSVTCEQLEAGNLGRVCCENPSCCDGIGCDFTPEECDHYWFVDPDTEIDRLARLIVDWEYRRRAEQEATSA